MISVGLNKTMKYSIFDSQYDVMPGTVKTDWKSFVTKLFTDNFEVVVDKTNYKHFSMSTYIPSLYVGDVAEKRKGWKNEDCTDMMYGLVLDYDDGLPVEKALERFKDYEYFFYTSYNHQKWKDGKPPVDKFRIILPFHEPINKKRWDTINEHVITLAGNVDPASKKFVQCFCLPATHPDNIHNMKMLHNEGNFLDWEEFPTNPKKENTYTAQGSVAHYTSGNTFLPTDIIPLQKGSIVAKDIADVVKGGKKLKCYCIYHNDHNPDAFVAVGPKGGTYLHCKKCGTAWMKVDKPEDDDASILSFVKKSKDKPKSEEHKPLKPDLTLVDVPERNHLEYNDKYCKPIPYRKGCFFGKSPKGTGKTYQLVEYVKTCKGMDKSILLIGHRVLLLKEMADRLGLAFYKDVNFSEKQKHLAICINSLSKITMQSMMRKYDIILIDESEQVFQNLTCVGGTIQPNERQAIMQTFYNLMTKAESIVAMDADLSDLTIDAISYFIKKDTKLLGHVNTFKVANKHMTMYENKMNLIEKMKNDIEEGKSVYLATDSPNFIEWFGNQLTMEDIKYTKITGQNSDTCDAKNFLEWIGKAGGEDVKGLVLLASPSLGTGIDIQARFDVVYGLFEGQTVTHYDMDQQVSRVRNADEFNVWINAKCRSEDDDWRVIRSKTKNFSKITEQLVGQTEQYQHKNWFNFLLDVHSMTVAHRNKSMNNLRENYKLLKEYQGWTIETVTKTESGFKKSDIKELRELNRTLLKSKLTQAPTLSFEEYNQVKNQKAKSTMDKIKCIKYEIETFWCDQIEKNDAIVDWYLGEERIQQVKYELLMMSDDELIERDKGQLQSHHLIDRKNYMMKRQLWFKGLALLGVFNDGQVNEDVLFCKTDERVERFIDWAKGEKDSIKSRLGISVDGKSSIDEPIRVVKSFCKGAGLLIGLEHIKQEGSKGKQVKTRYYSIDKSDLNRKGLYAERRNAG